MNSTKVNKNCIANSVGMIMYSGHTLTPLANDACSRSGSLRFIRHIFISSAEGFLFSQIHLVTMAVVQYLGARYQRVTSIHHPYCFRLNDVRAFSATVDNSRTTKDVLLMNTHVCFGTIIYTAMSTAMTNHSCRYPGHAKYSVPSRNDTVFYSE